MTNSRLVLLTLAILLIAGAVIGVSAGLLPERVAAHFNAAGQPGGWTTRENYLSTIALLNAFVFALFCLLALVIGRIPNWAINVPNREYWLSPAIRPRTIQHLRSMLVIMGGLIVAQVLAVHLLTMRANRSDPVQLDGLVWLPLAVGGAVTLGLVIYLLRRFRRPL